MTTEEVTIFNKWEMVAIVELLVQKGLCTKQDPHAIINELRKKNPCARFPDSLNRICSPKLRTRSSTIDDILELLNKNELTSHQSMNLLERVGRRVAEGTKDDA